MEKGVGIPFLTGVTPEECAGSRSCRVPQKSAKGEPFWIVGT